MTARRRRDSPQPASAAVPEPALHELPETFALELTPAELAFLRLLVTNATVQPAELKKLCGEVQTKIEAHIGPLPLSG